MKSWFPCLTLVWLAAGSLVAQKLQTEITSVTVYGDRASVTRTGEASLLAGDYELVVKDLPVSLQDQSLRVSGLGSAAAKITDIKIETDYIDTIPKNKLSELKDQLSALVQEERIYADRQALLAKEKELLDQIKANAVSQNSSAKDAPKVPIEDWTKLYLFYDANFEKINDEIRTLEKKKNDLSVRKTSLQGQINQLSGYGKLTKKKVVLSVTATRAGSMKFDITYVINGARWYPVYDVRVSDEDKSVELVYYAMIAQSTGEDWKGVNLSISTARPDVSGSIPQLSSWYLHVYEGYRDGLGELSAMSSGAGGGAYKRAAKMAKDDYMAGEELEVSREEKALDIDVATVETKGTAVVFNVPKKSTIPSDKADHKVTISVEPLKADFEYASVPKVAELAYLKGRVENTTDVPFLAGNANIFFGTNFVGSSFLNTVMPTEKFDVSLGVDDGIKIKRQQIRDYKAEKGVFSKNTKKTFEYKITVESFKKTQDTITIQEQFPVSQDERIKVEAIVPEFKDKDQNYAAHPNGVIVRKDNGLIEWRLRIVPKQKIELRLKYTVEYPKELQIEGL